MVNLSNLFLRLKDLNITAKKLSDDTGISTGNISDWKSGRSMPKGDTLAKIADYLDCSVDYILGRTDIPNLITHENIESFTGISHFEESNTDTFKIAAFKGEGVEIKKISKEQSEKADEEMDKLFERIKNSKN